MPSKNDNNHWHKVTACLTSEEQIVAGDVGGNEAVLRANLFNEHGDRILLIYQINMQAIPPSELNQLRKVLQAQNLTPILLLPEGVDAVQLRPMSPAQVRTMQEKVARRKREAPKAQKPDLLVVP